MHEVVFDNEAINFLQKLPKEIKKRIYNKLISTKENPFNYFERLTEKKVYKIRIGEL